MEENPGQFLKNISIGSFVGITTRDNRNHIQKGKIVKILTHSEFHTHGIMVEIENGLKGRVKEIFDSLQSDIKRDKSQTSIRKDSNNDQNPIETSISINEDDTGYSYKKLFYPYIKEAKEITIEDAYIRLDYQIKNLVFFCSIIEQSDYKVCIKLVTNFENEYKKNEQQRKLEEVRSTLEEMNIIFFYTFDETLHDRCIKTDNGWKIILGRGLDIFKDTGSFYSPAIFDQTKRKCKKTEIIYIRN